MKWKCTLLGIVSLLSVNSYSQTEASEDISMKIDNIMIYEDKNSLIQHISDEDFHLKYDEKTGESTMATWIVHFVKGEEGKYVVEERLNSEEHIMMYMEKTNTPLWHCTFYMEKDKPFEAKGFADESPRYTYLLNYYFENLEVLIWTRDSLRKASEK